MEIDYDELRDFLKKNLRLKQDENRGWYGEHTITISLMIGNEQIDEVSINMPNTESQWSSNC